MASPKDPGFRPEPFRAAPWLPGAHAQTVAGRLFRRPRPPAFRRERIELPDGDFVDLDVPPSPGPGAPVVLLLHGLEGSARRGYAIHTYRELHERGVAAVGLNFRSCSGEPNRSARFFHSGDTDDLRFVLDLLAERFPGVPRGAVGFSLGGNALLKYLGEEGDTARRRLAAAVAVSVPYDLDAGARALERGPMGRLYTRIFLKSLIAKMEAKSVLLNGTCDTARVRRARTFREFDDAATAPIHGFASAADYYARSSSAGFLPAIRVPTLLLHAEDDPFLPGRWFPRDAVADNPCVQAVLTRAGGHVGFIEGPPWSPRFWAERQAAMFLAAALASSVPGRGPATGPGLACERRT